MARWANRLMKIHLNLPYGYVWTHLNGTYGFLGSYMIGSLYIYIVGYFLCPIAIMQERQEQTYFKLIGVSVDFVHSHQGFHVFVV